MRLSAGIRLGTYEVVAPLGVGGMGEVYRARDVRLGRDVAIKILTVSFAADAERIRRFEREAKTLALLNHPNIAAIYGFEDSGDAPALVMELVEGATLADRIKSGPIPVDEVVLIVKQIAEGMEYAHERGIVHRDLKPANVKVSCDDSVKILDFGLAKAVKGEAAETDVATSPTLTGMATQAGFIIGTAAYMSPEQAKGKPVDRRADIWAFGCVFYEMLTGKVAFGGETVTDILASVVRAEPDWSQLPAGTPLRARVLLQRCLQKDPKQRLRDIGDARISLDEIISGAALEAPAPGEVATASRWGRALPWALAGLLAAALIAVVAVWKIAAHATMPEAAMHFSAVTDFPGVQAQPSLSPDGRSVAFVSNRDGHYNIYFALVNGGTLVQITNDPNLKSHPVWSPDGTMIAYARLNDSGIWDVWNVPALGGAPRRLILNAADPAWSPDSRLLAYGNMADYALWICGASGENAHRVEGTAEREWIDAEPRFSPDGRKIAFAARNSGGGPYGELAVADLDSGKTRLLTHDNTLALSPAWSADGRFIYFASSRGGTLNIWKIGQDGSGLQQITAGEGDDAELDVSADGKRIVFSTLREHIALAELDLQAKPGQQSVKLLTTDTVRNQFGPVYSPDGSHLAYFSNLKGIEQEGISVADADGSNATPLVQDPRVNVSPQWTPDGKYLVYRSAATVFEKWEYRRVAVSGGAPQTLLTGDHSRLQVGPDGRLLFPGPNGEVETFDPRDNKTETLGTLPADARKGLLRWSPDGHSVAYLVSPREENDANSGLWVDDFKKPPRQVFRGWVVRYARGPGNEIYLLEGKPDLNGVLWKVGWDGQGLTRTPATIPILYNFNYMHALLTNQFDVSPDARHLAFQTEQILEESIGMIENVR
jgi:eukaryotic-like serine/threonine-protein kinase